MIPSSPSTHARFPPAAFRPQDDGITHINTYSGGRTPLGRWLSNFAYAPITLSPHGVFTSVEGYWYWLSCPPGTAEALRDLHGPQAKRTGQALRGPDWPRSPHFEAWVRAALRAKVDQHSRGRYMLRESTLPLVHYVVRRKRPWEPPGQLWVWEEYEAIRRRLQAA